MKKYIAIIIGLIIFFTVPHLIKGASKSELIELSRKVAKDYRSEQNFQEPCYIWWTEVSLGAILYALAIQEWGWKDWTVWSRTNNWGSLHWEQWMKKPKWFTTADNTRTRPIYESAYDWMYEKAHMIATKPIYNSCNIGYKQLFAYIIWPSADPNKVRPNGKTNSQHIYTKLAQLKSFAVEFDGMKGVPLPKVEEKKEIKMHNNNCFYAREIKVAKYIQLDIDGEMYKQIPIDANGDRKIKVFNCY